jgi:hypothetical protein
MHHKKRKIFQKNAIKRQMQQNKRKILYKQILSENRSTKMRIGIYTKQIGNCLDSKQVSQLMKTFSKIKSEKESHLSQSKPRRPYNILQSISQIRQRRPCKISQSHINTFQWNSDY